MQVGSSGSVITEANVNFGNGTISLQSLHGRLVALVRCRGEYSHSMEEVEMINQVILVTRYSPFIFS